MIVKEVGVAEGDNDRDTIHLLLDLPRTLNAAQLTVLTADLQEVRSVRIE